MTDIGDQEVMTINETAEFLRVSRQTVYTLAKGGAFAIIKIGKSSRVLKADVLAYLERVKNEQSKAKEGTE